MSDILTALAAPFPPDVISWRVGATTKDKSKGMALAYIDARDVQDRLDQVCGMNWQVRHPWSDGKKLACEIGIKIDGEWHWRGDGAGDSDVEAEKGAFSDSFKRAAVRWRIGRYLYDVDSPWVTLEAKGNSHVIAQSEMPKLRAALTRAAGTASIAPPPKVEAYPRPKPETEIEPWRASAKTIIAAIDAAPHLVGLNALMEQKGIDPQSANPRVGSDLEIIKRADEKAYAFLIDRAQKKRMMFLNAPGDQRKAS